MNSSEHQPWIGERWHVSLYNFNPEVTAQMTLPEKILVSDCTLREGEQQPGVVLWTEDKLRLAHALDEIGIPEIEVGIPAVSEEERKGIKAIANAGLKAQIRCVCRARKHDIDMAVDCGVSLISLSVPAGTPHREHVLGWSEEKTIEIGIEMTNYAHQQGLYVVVSAMDVPRTDPDFLERYLKIIPAEGHVDRMRLVDTKSAATPSAIKYLVRKAAELTHLPIEVHCHNDFGLGTANSLAAIEAGASVVSTSLNGMGERGGLAATEEVALALQVLYGVDLGLKSENFYKASLLLQELTNVKVQEHKPVVGENAFAVESGLALGKTVHPDKASMLLKDFGFPYLPEVVGQSFRLVLGEGSGRSTIGWKLKELGIDATDEQVADITAQVKHEGERTKSAVSDETFRKICQNVLSQ